MRITGIRSLFEFDQARDKTADKTADAGYSFLFGNDFICVQGNTYESGDAYYTIENGELAEVTVGKVLRCCAKDDGLFENDFFEAVC